jgi:hypothetical protein
MGKIINAFFGKDKTQNEKIIGAICFIMLGILPMLLLDVLYTFTSKVEAKIVDRLQQQPILKPKAKK